MQQLKTDTTWILLQHERLQTEVASEFLKHEAAGGIDLFIGTTRRWTSGRETRILEYDCYLPMALKEINRLVAACTERWPVLRAVVHHRLGDVPVSEISVVIGISAAHRSDAFDSCRWLIDTLKREVPIWKKEIYVDGTEVWVDRKRDDVNKETK